MSRFTEATIPEGVTVKYWHTRGLGNRIMCTTCTLFMDDEFILSGVAYVSPKENSPSKKIGRAVSLGRALKKLSEEYHQNVKGGNYVKL